METSFCLAALDEALLRHGTPKIFNTDQGAQFTSAAFTGKLEAAGVVATMLLHCAEISMDGRGRFMDNIFIERLWRSIKYEEIHRKAYADGREARAGISSWRAFYNSRRPHQAMNNQMPMAVWRACPCLQKTLKLLPAVSASAVGMWATRLRCPSEAAYPQPSPPPRFCPCRRATPPSASGCSSPDAGAENCKKPSKN